MNGLKAPLAWFGVSYLIFALISSYMQKAAVFLISLVFLALLIICFLLSRFSKLKKPTVLKRAGLILMSGFLSTLFYVGFCHFNETDISGLNEKTIKIEARIEEVSIKENKSASYTLKIISSKIAEDDKDKSEESEEEHSVIKSQAASLVEKKAILYTVTEEPFSYGDIIETNAVVKLPSAAPSFDFKRYYRELNISAQLMTRGEVVLIKKGAVTPMSLIKSLNQKLCEQLDLSLSSPYSGFMKAMLLGDTSELDPILEQSFSRSGLRHIFTVSGLHISFLSGMILLLLSFSPLPIRLRNILAIALTWLVVLLTGFGIPACRAGLMMTVYLLAPMFNRRRKGVYSLLASAVLIVMINPLSISSGSFLLTFSSTGGILLFSRRLSVFLYRKIKIKSKLILSLCSALGLTLSANFLMLPITGFIFKGISLVAPLTNILLLPLLPFILTGGILLCVFNFIPIIGGLLSVCIEGMLGVFLFVSSKAAAFPFAYLGLDYPFVMPWIFATVLLLFLRAFLFPAKKLSSKRRRRTKSAFPFSRVVLISAFGFVLLFLSDRLINRDIAQIAVFSSETGGTACIINGDGAVGTADVIAFGEDKRSDIELVGFLQSKNVRTINSYTRLDKKAESLKDLQYLLSLYKPQNVFLFPSDTLLAGNTGQAYRVFEGSDIYVVLEGGGYRINESMTAFNMRGKSREKSGVLMSIRDTDILFTQSVEIAKKVNPEILYFGEANEKINEQFPCKYAILVKKPEIDLQDIGKNAILSHERAVTLQINTKTGDYKLNGAGS